MTVKNNFKKQRKATQKRKQRDTKRGAIRNAGVFKDKEAAKKSSKRPAYDLDFVRNYVAEHGIERAVHDLKLKGDDSQFRNKDVMRIISDFIPNMMHVHAAMEITGILAQEGKTKVEPEFQELMDNYDILLKKVNIDINNIIVFIEAGKETPDYLELFVDFLNKIELMSSEVAKDMIPFFESRGDMLDNYYQEHRHDAQETQLEFSQRMHEQRATRIYPKQDLLPEQELVQPETSVQQ